MDQETADYIYWVIVAGAGEFASVFGAGEEYEGLLKERIKLSRRYVEARYGELKQKHTFSEARRIAVTEWLVVSSTELAH